MEYTISQAAEKFGITAHTLRFYDKEGLLPFVDRGAGGRRIFKDGDLGWLRIIGCLKDTGMPIREIRDYLDLCMMGDKTLQRRLEIMREHKAKMQTKLAEIKKYMKVIDFKLDYYAKAIAAGTEAVHRDKPEPETTAEADKKRVSAARRTRAKK
ncbi:MAG: MerR family transcriptional regulator [Candidatus Spyradosoma sp.]